MNRNVSETPACPEFCKCICETATYIISIAYTQALQLCRLADFIPSWIIMNDTGAVN